METTPKWYREGTNAFASLSKKKNFREELESEVINYGGMAATRLQAYNHALEACKKPGISEDRVREAADMFAYGPRAKALTANEAAKLLPFDPTK